MLFGLSWDFVGDLAETVALMWPADAARANAELSLSDVVEGLQTTPKDELPAPRRATGSIGSTRTDAGRC